MRYLRQQTLSRRIANDTTLYTSWDALGNIILNMKPSGGGALVVPNGSNANQPAGINGMMRYNNDVSFNGGTGRLEVYSAGRWRGLRFAEQGPIIQQNLGAGDSQNLFFGPLNSTYYNPSNNANGATVGGQNIIVVVENVIQLSGINYSVVQGSSITPTAETYTGYLAVAAGTSSSTIYFNSSLNVVSATWNSGTNTATLTLSNGSPSGSPTAAFAQGSTIVVTGIVSSGQNPSAFNGTFTVGASGSATTVTYTLSTNPGTYQNGGTATATGSYPAVFPAFAIPTNAVVSGSNIYSGSTVTSYTTDPNTDALTSVTLSHAPTGTIAVDTAITISVTPSYVSSSYYLQFSTPVPYGKVVIALLGFDS